ncbi:MAG TPA: amino acid adenylation domain-containing protein [Chitinophaga sp.]|uniref:non-ribosomal peptide synthetase n=1 Tax=Chitinophaga sp. TaxID=1869181 RepID=UPI002CDDD03E|nr:amino acid adenylation domain-containing protein [Chitinophaga sp.]HVI44932.1 amino acid adenylation domain-containing protein [Chitinophaga sp.]
MKLKSLIDELIGLGIHVHLQQGELKISGPQENITPEVISKIRENKAALIGYLEAADDRQHLMAAIPRTEEKACYELSSAQRRLWILSQLGEASIGYNMTGVCTLEGALDEAALEQAFHALIARHESLRTIFEEDSTGIPKQRILPPGTAGFSIIRHDLRAETHPKVAETLVRCAFSWSFDLSCGPLLRAELLRVEEEKRVFVYVMHHIISDGWSMGVLINELLQLYHAYANGLTAPLLPLRIQYRDYAAWQEAQLKEDAMQRSKYWWMEQFSGELPVLDLAWDKIRPAVKTYNGSSVSMKLPAGDYLALKDQCAQHGASLFMGLLAVAKALLYRYTQQEDIIIGTPMAGREHPDLEGQIGFYVNTLALRTRFSGKAGFRELLEEVKQVTLDAYNHQAYPFDELVDMLKLPRDMSRNPLFDTVLYLQQFTAEQPQQGNLKIGNYNAVRSETAPFDLMFSFTEMPGELQLELIYNTDIYTRDFIQQLAAHYGQLMKAAVAAPQQPLMQLELLSAAERQQLLHDFNNTTAGYTAANLVGLFRETVARTPDHPATVYEETTLTYRELDAYSERLAAYLKNKCQAGADECIGIMLDRSAFMIIAMLGVLKAGAAYLPVDYEYPQARKEYMLKDAGVRTLITQRSHAQDAGFFPGHLFIIDEQLESLDTDAPLDVKISPRDMAYVIYTSGSTGLPKGVVIEHAAFLNNVLGMRDVFGVAAGARGLQFSSPSFDASVWDIFVVLASGGTVYIVNDTVRKHPAMLEEYIREHAITTAFLPPAYSRLLSKEKIGCMTQLITGGEAAIVEDAQEFAKYGAYYNGYGPTETTICTSIFRLMKGEVTQYPRIPIGLPLANTRLYVLDEHLHLLPLGVPGEIYIGGAGLARGYLNNPALTEERFVPDPFRPGEKMYKTGDTGRWLADGNMDYFGRRDNQVKLRGYRIELGEIETALQSHPLITGAVVLIRTGASGDKELAAWFTAKEILTVQDIRSYLGNSLPAYMLPAHYVQLEEFPLNTNRKVDRHRLPDPAGAGAASAAAYVAPGNELEEKLVAMWQEVLGKNKIGIRDNFFELGGHSLSAIRLRTQIHQEFNVAIRLEEMYNKATIEEIAHDINRKLRLRQSLETNYANEPAAGSLII